MNIHYVLFENKLVDNPNAYRAVVQPYGKADVEDLANRIIKQGSTVTRPDILSVLEDCFCAIEDLVLLGYNVSTPLARYRASIRGIFEGQTDSFDPSRHNVAVTITPSKRLRQAVKTQARVVKKLVHKPRPTITAYTDYASGTTNSVLTPGGMGQIAGGMLRFDPADTEQGIFFRNGDGTFTRVEEVGKNMPGELSFIVPALPSGEYKLEVRAAFNGGDVRSSVLSKVLTAS